MSAFAVSNLGAASQPHVQSPIHSKVYAFDVFEIDDLLAVGTDEPPSPAPLRVSRR
jgi:hypothetical protein